MHHSVSVIPILLKKAFLLAATSIVLLSGCNRKSNSVSGKIPLPLSEKSKLLTAHTWKETSVVVHKFINGDTILYNVTKQFSITDRDDYTVFYPDGTFLFEEGKSKFAARSAQKYQRGTWQLEENESVLSLTFNQSTDRYAILALTPFNLVLSLAGKDAAYRYTITYVPEVEITAATPQTEDPVYTEVDIAPQYPGGTESLIRMLRQKQKYPREARKRGIEGNVLIGFTIHKDGKASDFEVIQSLGYGCDEAALQTLQTMSSWKSGEQDGKPVNVRMFIPIAFKLN